MILVRILIQTEYGLYRQYYLLFDTMNIFFWMGLSNSMLYFIPRLSEQQSKSFLSQTLMISSACGIISFVAVLLSRKLIAIYLNVEITKHLFLFAGFVCFHVSSSFFENLLIAERRTIFSSVFSVLYYLVLFFVTVVIATMTKNASAIFYVLMPVAFLRYLLVVIYSVSRYGFTLTIDRSLIKKHLNYCIPLAIGGIFYTAAFSIDKYIVSMLNGSVLFALYAIGAIYLPISEFTSSPASLVAMPVMVKLENEKNHHLIAVLYREMTRKISLFFSPIVIFFLFIARDLIVVLFGAAYAGATPILRLYVLAVIPEMFVVELIFSVFDKTGLIWIVNLIKLVVIGVLAFWFNSIWGYIGIALAFTLSRYIGFLFAILKVKALLAMSAKNLIEYGQLAKNVLISIIALIPLILIHSIAALNRIIFLVTSVFVYFSAYLLLAYFLKALKEQDIDSLKSLIPNFFVKRFFHISEPK